MPRRSAIASAGTLSWIPTAGSTACISVGVPSHAIELAAVYLDRNVEAVLSSTSDKALPPQKKQDLAAVIHLCGARPARDFARRGFRVTAGRALRRSPCHGLSR